MTYIDLYASAVYDLKYKNITLEEYQEIIKPLRKEVDSDIKELEKIKAEIEKKQEEVIGINQKANFQNKNDYGMYYGYESSIEIIDNHIFELKGEQK